MLISVKEFSKFQHATANVVCYFQWESKQQWTKDGARKNKTMPVKDLIFSLKAELTLKEVTKKFIRPSEAVSSLKCLN